LDEDSALDETNLQVAVCVIGRRKYEGFPPFLIVIRGRPARYSSDTQNFRVPNDRIIAHMERQGAGIPFNGQAQDPSGSISNKMKNKNKHWFDS
jgi:hypothetical protein